MGQSGNGIIEPEENQVLKCSICGVSLVDNPTTNEERLRCNCGGDCLMCMADAGDLECLATAYRILKQAVERPGKVVSRWRREKILSSLEDYRCFYSQDEDGGGLKLVYHLSPGADFSTGEDELKLLADFLDSSLEAPGFSWCEECGIGIEPAILCSSCSNNSLDETESFIPPDSSVVVGHLSQFALRDALADAAPEIDYLMAWHKGQESALEGDLEEAKMLMSLSTVVDHPGDAWEIYVEATLCFLEKSREGLEDCLSAMRDIYPDDPNLAIVQRMWDNFDKTYTEVYLVVEGEEVK